MSEIKGRSPNHHALMVLLRNRCLSTTGPDFLCLGVEAARREQRDPSESGIELLELKLKAKSKWKYQWTVGLQSDLCTFYRHQAPGCVFLPEGTGTEMHSVCCHLCSEFNTLTACYFNKGELHQLQTWSLFVIQSLPTLPSTKWPSRQLKKTLCIY